MAPTNSDADRQSALVQIRINAFRASIRTHGLGSADGSSRLSIGIHGLDASEPDATALASNKFLRNAILGTTVAISAIWSANAIHDAMPAAQKMVEKAHTTAELPQLPVVVAKPDLRNIEYVLTSDMSNYSANDIRQNLKYATVLHNGKSTKTLDVPSRVLLTKWASDSSSLNEVGLGWKDLYGVIHAESSWISRSGMGKNGVQSDGLAQFEPKTAKSYGLKNAYEPLAAVSAAAMVIKDAALWTQKRFAAIDGDDPKDAQALRDGVSVFYNTGWVRRHQWTPKEGHLLPDATKNHIRNVKAGEMIAQDLVKQVRSGAKVVTPTASLENSAVHRANRLMTHLRSRDQVEPSPSDDQASMRRVSSAREFLSQQSVSLKRHIQPI